MYETAWKLLKLGPAKTDALGKKRSTMDKQKKRSKMAEGLLKSTPVLDEEARVKVLKGGDDIDVFNFIRLHIILTKIVEKDRKRVRNKDRSFKKALAKLSTATKDNRNSEESSRDDFVSTSKQVEAWKAAYNTASSKGAAPVIDIVGLREALQAQKESTKNVNLGNYESLVSKLQV
mmetsp:Transcript_10717/g.12278  ORF Transcript_10717/g.12278 Transcript_10717/m.12278 type:complete len:176 (-) Transcript_10717:1260-1787(-)